MKLLLDTKTKRNLAVILKDLPQHVKSVQAAIAYNRSSLLMDACVKRKLHLEWWGLLDASGSSDLELIKRALSSDYVRFYPFAELFHPKIIYFEGFGLYIGSANMTDSALYYNVEAGVFVGEADLDTEARKEIIGFFEFLRQNSVPASSSDIDNIEQFLQATVIERNNVSDANTHIEDVFEECLSHLFTLKPGATDFERKKGDRLKERKLRFMQEWRETQNYLQHVKERIVERAVNPVWVRNDAHPTIVTDQLLHAYYYSYILNGTDEGRSIDKVQEAFKGNRQDPEKTINSAIDWWLALPDPPLDEDKHINEWGFSNQALLATLKERDLTLPELKRVLQQNHAARNHARQIKNSVFGLPDDFKAPIEERVDIYASWLSSQKSQKGKSVSDVFRYVLFSEAASLEERIYQSLFSDEFRIAHLGKSIIGEVVGWGRPDIAHLRNNRVNKGLRCLGYDVRLFSE